MTWEEIIEIEKQKPYYKTLKDEIDKRYETSRVFPEKKNIFKAFSLSKIEDLKVNINDNEILKGINLEAPRGETIALVGDSGGGKSSLINLIISEK